MLSFVVCLFVGDDTFHEGLATLNRSFGRSNILFYKYWWFKSILMFSIFRNQSSSVKADALRIRHNRFFLFASTFLVYKYLLLLLRWTPKLYKEQYEMELRWVSVINFLTTLRYEIQSKISIILRRNIFMTNVKTV